MAWMRRLLLGESRYTLDKLAAKASASRVDRMNEGQKYHGWKLNQKNKKIRSLEDELKRHKLAIEALTRFLVEKGVVNEGEFESFIEEVDSEDGLVDGKLAVDPKTGKLVYGYQPNQLSIEG